MNRQSPLALIAFAIVLIVAVNVVLSLGLPKVAIPTAVADAIVIALVVYIAGTILLRVAPGLRVPSLKRKPRMRVVKNDPSKAASDFIRQFEERAKR